MNVGDKVLAVPIDGDPHNVIFVPAGDVLEVGSTSLTLPLDGMGQNIAVVGQQLLLVGDSVLCLPIDGNPRNLIIFNGRVCEFHIDTEQIFWAHDAEINTTVEGTTESETTIDKTITLPTWWKPSYQIWASVDMYWESVYSGSIRIAYFFKNSASSTYNIVVGYGYEATGWRNGIIQNMGSGLNGGDTVSVSVSHGKLRNFRLLGEPLTPGCPPPTNS